MQGQEVPSGRTPQPEKASSRPGISSTRSLSSRSQSPDKIAALRTSQPAGLDLVVSARGVTA